MQNKQLYIGGKWLDGHSGEKIPIENPASREIFASVPAGDMEDVNRAVKAAQRGFSAWSVLSGAERAKYLYRLADFFEKNADKIADTIVQELGAPVKIAKDWHVAAAGRETRYYAKIASTFPYEEAKEGYLLRWEPVGIVAGLTPWNYPLDQVTLKLLPALAAGNSVILKPSQLAPLSSYWFVRGTIEAGFPAGVFNLVTGRGGEVGNLLASHPEIRMISFTGSTGAGREVGRSALCNIKKIALELGGKSAAVVLNSASFPAAAQIVAEDCFMNSGQTCNAMTRMLVPRNRLREMETLLRAEADKYVVGDPRNPSTDIGPLISAKAFEKVKTYIKAGLSEGAELIAGGLPKDSEKGLYIRPTVFSHVDNHMKIAQEEIFGPVLSVIAYDTQEEAIDIVNDSPYGLCGGVFGNKQQAIAVARRMDTGVIRINGAAVGLGVPFGGYKQSGLGRENGAEAFREYMEVKAIVC